MKVSKFSSLDASGFVNSVGPTFPLGREKSKPGFSFLGGRIDLIPWIQFCKSTPFVDGERGGKGSSYKPKPSDRLSFLDSRFHGND
jgi:hypothetical protein